MLECREQISHLSVPLLHISNNNSHNSSNSSYSSQQFKIQRSPVPSTSQLFVEHKRLLTGQQHTHHTLKRTDVTVPKMQVYVSFINLKIYRERLMSQKATKSEKWVGKNLLDIGCFYSFLAVSLKFNTLSKFCNTLD